MHTAQFGMKVMRHNSGQHVGQRHVVAFALTKRNVGGAGALALKILLLTIGCGSADGSRREIGLIHKTGLCIQGPRRANAKQDPYRYKPNPVFFHSNRLRFGPYLATITVPRSRWRIARNRTGSVRPFFSIRKNTGLEV